MRTPKRHVAKNGVVTWRVRFRVYDDPAGKPRGTSLTFATETDALEWVHAKPAHLQTAQRLSSYISGMTDDIPPLLTTRQRERLRTLLEWNDQ